MLIPGALYCYRIMCGKVQQAAENITPCLIRAFPLVDPYGPTNVYSWPNGPA